MDFLVHKIFDVVGFESRRSDSPQVGRDLVKNVLKMIVYETQKSEIDIYVESFINKIRTGEFTAEDIGLPIGISKHLHEYGNQIHARAARYANENHNAGIKKGDKIKYIYIKNNNDVIAFKNYLWDGYNIDNDKMIRRIVDMKIGPLYKSLGWDYKYVMISNPRKLIKKEDLYTQKELWK